MEIRSLQNTGGSSYIVTLPKNWVIQHNLASKKQLRIYDTGHGPLILHPHSEDQSKKVTLDIFYLSNQIIERELIGLYLSGVDDIHLVAQSITYEQRSVIRSIAKKLFGFEIMHETGQLIQLKYIATNKISTEMYVEKMMLMTYSMFQDTQEAVLKNDRNLARDIIERDIEIDRIHLIIIREFKSQLVRMIPTSNSHLKLTDLHYHEHVAIRIERIADHIVRIATTLNHLPKHTNIHLNTHDLAKLKKLHEYFMLIKEALFPLTPKKAHQLLDLFHSIPKADYLTTKNISKPASHLIILDSIDRIRSYCANIAEEIINYAYVVK